MVLNAYVAYYFAIRSGNWQLRNESLKIITQLFFAYSHNKYECLCVNTICNSLTCPKEFAEYFKDGQWTCSMYGNPYHNLALDEAHECVINRRLKSITSRPSTFRTVELAGFLAYADKVVLGVESYINDPKLCNQIKRFACERLQRF